MEIIPDESSKFLRGKRPTNRFAEGAKDGEGDRPSAALRAVGIRLNHFSVYQTILPPVLFDRILDPLGARRSPNVQRAPVGQAWAVEEGLSTGLIRAAEVFAGSGVDSDDGSLVEVFGNMNDATG